MAVPAVGMHVHTRTQAQAPKHVRALSAGPSRVLQAVMENQQTKPGYTLIKQHIAEGRGAPPQPTALDSACAVLQPINKFREHKTASRESGGRPPEQEH